MHVSIEEYDESDHSRTAQLIECYKDVFQDRPWNEWLKCCVCGKYWGTKDREELVQLGFIHCEKPLVDFWTRTEVLGNIRRDLVQDSSCWLAVDQFKVIGFCWGYPMLAGDLEKKLGLEFDPTENLSGRTIAYQNEVGVLLNYRNFKVAKRLVLKRLEDFLSKGLKYGVVRTRQFPEPSVTYTWYTEKLGYRVIARYPGNDGRVVLGREFDEELRSSLSP